MLAEFEALLVERVEHAVEQIDQASEFVMRRLLQARGIVAVLQQLVEAARVVKRLQGTANQQQADQ